jgi:predicted AlkP superfamily pyrophosphatase or phosphodiesterase
VKTEFPHVYDDGTAATRAAFAKQVLWTPFGDEMSLAFARALVGEERLGADDVPDVLMLSLSSADYIGHAYGPFSHEMQDYYLRLDAYLGEFLGTSTRRSARTAGCWP